MALYLPYIVGGSSVFYLSNKIYGLIYDTEKSEITNNYFDIQEINLEKTTEEKVEKTTEEKTTEEKVEKTTEEKVEKILKHKQCKLCHTLMPINCFSKKQLRKKSSICKVCWKLN